MFAKAYGSVLTRVVTAVHGYFTPSAKRGGRNDASMMASVLRRILSCRSYDRYHTAGSKQEIHGSTHTPRTD